MCGIGVAMGLQALGGYNSRRSQLAQYQAQAQNYQNMANVAQSNANMMRYNETLTGRAGAQEQSQIRQRGKTALANINVGASANNISGASVDYLRGTSAKATADDINTSKYNTNVQMYGQEVQAQNYEQQANVYQQYANAYRDMGHESNFMSLLTTLPNVLQSYYGWQNATQSSKPVTTSTSGYQPGSLKSAGFDTMNESLRAFNTGDVGKDGFWISSNSVGSGTSAITDVGETKSRSLNVTIPETPEINDYAPEDVLATNDPYSGWSIYNYMKNAYKWSNIYPYK